MNNEIANKVFEMLEQVAEQLGVAAGKLYPILLRQARIDGLTKLIVPLVLILISLIAIYTMIKIAGKTENSSCFDYDDFFIASTIPTLAIIVNLGYLVWNIKNIATALYNPDWYIINELLANLIR